MSNQAGADASVGRLEQTDDQADARITARRIVDEVRAAQQAWAELPVGARAEKLASAGKAMLARAEELAELVVQETGKPLAESYSSEVVGVADLFGYWCKNGPLHLSPRKGQVPSLEMPGKKARIERVPRGVVAVIAPWNYPVAIPMRSIVPALLAGNGVVLKPSEITPLSGAWLVEQLRSTLGPLIALMPGAGAAGAALVQAQPDLVIFTGSTATGRKVATAAAALGIPCDSELGGKDCAIVRADADVERTAAGIAWGILTNAGQNCAGIERVAVDRAIADKLLSALTARLNAAAGQVPELVTPRQKAIVIDHIEDAVAQGGKLLCGGLPEGDAPVPPTLIAELPRTARAWTDESFGPIAVVTVCDGDEALIAAANDSEYGLGASVWSRDVDAAVEIGRRVRSGMLWVNNHAFTGALPDLPWTGTGGSGTGITSSPEAIEHMTRPRLVVVDRNAGLEPWWYPYGEQMVGLMRAVVRKQKDGGPGALFATLGALKRRQKEQTQGQGG